MGLKPSPKHTLERINGDGNYEPENCRWATDKEQARNQRGNRLLTINGVIKCVTEWAEHQGVSADLIRSRLKAGQDAATAVLTPRKRPSGKIVLNDLKKDVCSMFRKADQLVEEAIKKAGNGLRAYRESKGLSVRRAATVMRVSAQFISKVEMGEKRPPSSLFDRYRAI
jgi:hypothetical protein